MITRSISASAWKTEKTEAEIADSLGSWRNWGPAYRGKRPARYGAGGNLFLFPAGAVEPVLGFPPEALPDLFPAVRTAL